MVRNLVKGNIKQKKYIFAAPTPFALENGAHVQKKVSHLFLATHKDKWILSSLTIFVP